MRRSFALAASSALVVSLAVPVLAGSVKGKATFGGKAPKGGKVQMAADAKCNAQHPGGFNFSAVEINAKGGVANVFVYVKKGAEGKKFAEPTEPKVLIDQKGCWYAPRVAGVMVGQKFIIKNSDPLMHNVNAGEFNQAMPEALKTIEKTFKKPKVMLKIKCNVHPWMTSYVGVLEHPYYAVTGADGSYEIPDLPAGKYTLEAWHEKLGSVTQEVTVAAGGASADFKLKGIAAP